MVTHVPLCFNCDTREVEAPFTYADGTGFCSASCEKTANDEFAEHFAEYDEDRKLDGDMAEPFDRDMRDDEAALESVYGPSDDSGYDDFNDWG